jgi:uncharacterized protein with GYD domain
VFERRNDMPKYISLVSYTEEGIKSIKDTGKRAKAFAEKLEKKGIHMKSTLWTIGRYDLVHIFEAPNDDAAATVAFALGSMGNVRTETMRAYNLEEMKAIIGDVYELHVDSGTLK